MKLGQEIRAAREDKDLSRRDLARRLGVSYESVRQWESGESIPESERFISIAEALDIPLEHFLRAAGILREENATYTPVRMPDVSSAALRVARKWDRLAPEAQRCVDRLLDLMAPRQITKRNNTGG